MTYEEILALDFMDKDLYNLIIKFVLDKSNSDDNKISLIRKLLGATKKLSYIQVLKELNSRCNEDMHEKIDDIVKELLPNLRPGILMFLRRKKEKLPPKLHLIKNETK